MKAVTIKNDNFLATELPTMTSLEMVDYINADRKSKSEAEGLTFPCKKYRKLQHNNFMAKVPKVRETSAKFLADDIFPLVTVLSLLEKFTDSLNVKPV